MIGWIPMDSRKVYAPDLFSMFPKLTRWERVKMFFGPGVKFEVPPYLFTLGKDGYSITCYTRDEIK